jgi:hypothetical protein
MSNDQLRNDIKHLDRALDALCQAASELGQSTDWVGGAALVTLEGMIDDLGERVTELRGIRDVMNKMKEER